VTNQPPDVEHFAPMLERVVKSCGAAPIEQARGLRQLPMRGLAKARAEWSLICLTHDLLELHGATG
jgi:hypothetical protein